MILFRLFPWIGLTILLSGSVGGSPAHPAGENDDDPVIHQSCASNGEKGICEYFKDCHPILFGFSTGQSTYASNSELQQDVLEAATLCKPRDNSTDPGDVIICCVASNGGSRNVRNSVVVAAAPPSTKIVPGLEGAPGTKQPGSTTFKEKDNIQDADCNNPYVVNFPAPLNEQNAPRGAYPWMAALMNNRNSQFCGGSIIDNYHILTAAHCIAHIKNPEQLAKVKVMMGINNLIFPENSKQERNVQSIARHAEYSDKNITNDIALLKLDQPITFEKYVQPLCMNKETTGYADGTKQATLAGWGRTSVIGGPSPILRHGTMKVWTNEECQQRYSDFFAADEIPKVQPTMVCAGSPGVDACQGDSGGPLFMKMNNQSFYQQIGVVSWGIGCGIYPGVYTRVDQYIDWVNANRGLGVVETMPSEATTTQV